jgi:hypothetical protein
MIGDSELSKRFRYHHSNTSQSQIFDDIGILYFNFSKIIDEKCPDSREKSLAITQLEFAYLMTIASVSRNDESDEIYKTDEVAIDTPMGKAKRKLKDK